MPPVALSKNDGCLLHLLYSVLQYSPYFLLVNLLLIQYPILVYNSLVSVFSAQIIVWVLSPSFNLNNYASISSHKKWNKNSKPDLLKTDSNIYKTGWSTFYILLEQGTQIFIGFLVIRTFAMVTFITHLSFVKQFS